MGKLIGVVYLSTTSSSTSKKVLQKALSHLLQVLSKEGESPQSLYELYYEHNNLSTVIAGSSDGVIALPPLGLDLAFNDATMGNVQIAYETITRNDEGAVAYMDFEDREGTGDNDAFE